MAAEANCKMYRETCQESSTLCAHCAENICVSNAMNIISMLKTVDILDRLQCQIDFALRQSILILQRLYIRLHFAIHFCIAQRILALKDDPLDCCTEHDAQQSRSANQIWMLTACTGMSLLTCMVEMLLRKLANHIQAGSTTPWHAYCSTIRHLFNHHKFANRRYQARMAYNQTLIIKGRHT